MYPLWPEVRFLYGMLTLAWSPGCLDVTLTDEEVKYLEEPYQPTKISGHM